jgi:NodT family efflux transporter outer membrane factor (OMF) lipoprotein
VKKCLPLLPALSLFAAACASGPDYQAPAPASLGVPNLYYGAAGAALSPAELAAWWRQFDDPQLDGLIRRAIADNLDLAIASARLRQARESLVQARAGRLPSVDASGRVDQSFDLQGNSDTNLSLGVDAAWEADLFGGISRGIEAARADEQSVAFDLAAVQVAIIGDVATNYIEARLAQARLANALDTLAISEENLEIANWRLQAGLVSSIDVEQARGQRAQTAATIPTLEQSFASATYRLAVLTGQAPGAVTAALAAPRPIPGAPATVAVGIPADALRQRPDVRSAERDLAAATARIGVAEAQLRPALRIAGNIGTSALSVGGLLDAITNNIFASLGAPLFDGGRLRSQVRAQQAATDLAYASYRQSVLTALEDVENGLVALQTAQRREREFEVALDAANNQAILARSSYRAGLTDFQTLLEAERALISARDGTSTSRADRALAIVQLYRALGGGWHATPLPQGNRA